MIQHLTDFKEWDRHMSDIDQQNNDVEPHDGDTYDYKAEQATPNKEPEPEPKVEPVEGEVGGEPKGDETPNEVVEEDNKPWKKGKQETPSWARKRFKSYSQTVNELKEQNQQLMETVKEVLNQNKPKTKELTKADFPDEDSYLDYRVEQKTQAQLDKYADDRKANKEQEVEQQKYTEADQRNITNAQSDLPDYNEVIQQGDPDIALPQNVIQHLSMSPAGPYVKYKIASDEDLSESLKRANPQEKLRIVSELHDGILDHLVKRGNTPQAKTEPEPTPQQAAPTATAPKPRPKPKAPPKVKSGKTRDIMSLSGDDYARARNKQGRR